MSSSASLLLVLLAATGFSKAQSPSPVSTVYVTPVPSPTPPTCPGSDGKTYSGPSGSDFIIECGVDHAGGDMSNTRVDTFEQCILACDKEPACVDVSLSGVACYLKSVTGTAIFQADVFGARRLPSTSSSASTPTATPAPISCPASNDTIFTANSYARFEIGCDYETAGGDIGRAFVFSFEECVQTCDSTEGSCYLKSELGSRSNSIGVSYARLTAERPQCPSPANTTYTAANGKQFAIECDTDYLGGDIDSAVLDSPDGSGDGWFGQCIEMCAANPNCVDISLSGAGCYLKGAPLGPASNTTGILGARWVDAPTVAPTPSPSPSPTPSAISPIDVGSFEYLACYNDSVGARALQGDFLYGTKQEPMTAEVCAEFCEDSMYFGLEYSQECYCADTLSNHPIQIANACNMACAGDETQLCGGSDVLSLYRSLSYNGSRVLTPIPSSSGTAISAFPTSTGASLNGTNSTGGFSWASNTTSGFRFVKRQPKPAPVRLGLAYMA